MAATTLDLSPEPKLSLPCRIFVPATAAVAKAEAIESRGATHRGYEVAVLE